MNVPRTSRFFVSLIIGSVAVTSLHAETLYGPGTINIPTNQAIIINTVGRDTAFSIDGHSLGANSVYVPNPRFAIAGAHALGFTNENGAADVFVTFQRLKTSAIKTVVVSGGQTNFVAVPAGKTIQFFDSLNTGVGTGVLISIQPTNSASSYVLNSGDGIGNFYYSHPSATGPGTVTISTLNGGTSVVSYYFVTKPRVAPPTDLIY